MASGNDKENTAEKAAARPVDRRSLVVGGGMGAGLGALAAVGLAAGLRSMGSAAGEAEALSAPRASARIDGSVADQPEPSGVDACADASDFDALVSAGFSPNAVACASTLGAAPQPGSVSARTGTGSNAVVTWDFANVPQGAQTLFEAVAYAPAYREVDDPSIYPEGWTFAAWDGVTPLEISSLEEVGRAACAAVPSAGSGTVRATMALPVGVDADGLVVKASFRAIGSF